MSRMRSPSYPSVPLRQAVDLVAKIHRTCRTNIITRENAVQEMGYSGLTGRSMKVLAALLQFGLLEKTGKGDVKVTQRAVDILHGIDEADRNEAMLEAAYAPQLFRDIHERFPDGIPSEGVIRSFLIQQDFMDAAISPAINAFMETYRSVEHIRESESHGADDNVPPDSSEQDGRGNPTPPPPPPPPPPGPQGGYRIMENERVVFSEETGPEQYLKLVAAGEMNEALLEALEDYIKRQKRRLNILN